MADKFFKKVKNPVSKVQNVANEAQRMAQEYQGAAGQAGMPPGGMYGGPAGMFNMGNNFMGGGMGGGGMGENRFNAANARQAGMLNAAHNVGQGVSQLGQATAQGAQGGYPGAENPGMAGMNAAFGAMGDMMGNMGNMARNVRGGGRGAPPPGIGRGRGQNYGAYGNGPDAGTGYEFGNEFPPDPSEENEVEDGNGNVGAVTPNALPVGQGVSGNTGGNFGFPGDFGEGEGDMEDPMKGGLDALNNSFAALGGITKGATDSAIKVAETLNKLGFAPGTFVTGRCERQGNVLEQKHVVRYQGLFKSVPKIGLGIPYLDIGHERNPRLEVNLTEKNETMMVMNLRSWADTVHYGSGASYIISAPTDTDFQMGTYSTLDKTPWDHTPPEFNNIQITFPEPYKGTTPPKVVAWLTHIDFNCTITSRVELIVHNVTNQGFQLNIRTWSGTQSYGTAIGWAAHSVGRPDVFMTSLCSRDKNPQCAPLPWEENFDVTFDAHTQFSGPPKVFLALNYLDIDSSANLRMKMIPKNITPKGLTVDFHSWADTKKFNIGGVVIAVDPAYSREVEYLMLP